MIVDMTKKAKHGMQKRKPKAPPAGQELSTWVRSQQNDSVHRISQRAMLTEAFYERFLTYFTSDGDERDIQNRLSWLHLLPAMSTDGTNDALQLAIQATAAAHCALESTSSNPALTRHAWNLYGEALQKHGRTLARSPKQEGITIHMVSTSILFSFFEAIQATNAYAYRHHIYGAAKLMEAAGRRECSRGVLCQVFYHLRTQLVFVTLIGRGGETPVEVTKILHQTLDYKKLPIFQRLMTHVDTLVEMYVMQQDGEIDSPIDLVTYMQAKAEVNGLWQEYNETAADQGKQLTWIEARTQTTQFRDAFTALTIAYFECARALLAIVAPQFAVSFVDLTDHYAAILDASQFLRDP